jgi:hypothetical protein
VAKNIFNTEDDFDFSITAKLVAEDFKILRSAITSLLKRHHFIEIIILSLPGCGPRMQGPTPIAGGYLFIKIKEKIAG